MIVATHAIENISSMLFCSILSFDVQLVSRETEAKSLVNLAKGPSLNIKNRSDLVSSVYNISLESFPSGTGQQVNGQMTKRFIH